MWTDGSGRFEKLETLESGYFEFGKPRASSSIEGRRKTNERQRKLRVRRSAATIRASLSLSLFCFGVDRGAPRLVCCIFKQESYLTDAFSLSRLMRSRHANIYIYTDTSYGNLSYLCGVLKVESRVRNRCNALPSFSKGSPIAAAATSENESVRPMRRESQCV